VNGECRCAGEERARLFAGEMVAISEGRWRRGKGRRLLLPRAEAATLGRLLFWATRRLYSGGLLAS